MSTRRFSKVSAALWRSNRFRNLATDAAKLLYHYFLTSDHQSSIGAYSVPDGYVLDDLGWEQKAYVAARKLLIAAELIAFDEETATVYVLRWFKHSPPMNDKHAQGCMRQIGELESAGIAEKVLADFDEAERKRRENGNPIPIPFPQSAGAQRWPVRAANGR